MVRNRERSSGLENAGREGTGRKELHGGHRGGAQRTRRKRKGTSHEEHEDTKKPGKKFRQDFRMRRMNRIIAWGDASLA
jgi:hypothetical protein